MITPNQCLPPPLCSPVSLCLPSFSVPHQSVTQPSATPAALSSLSPIIPSVPPLPPLSGVVTLWACCEPLPPGHGDHEAPPPDLDLSILPRFVALIPEPVLLLPLPTVEPIRHSASPGSLGPSAPPGSDITLPMLWTFRLFAALRPSTLMTPASSILP